MVGQGGYVIFIIQRNAINYGYSFEFLSNDREKVTLRAAQTANSPLQFEKYNAVRSIL